MLLDDLDGERPEQPFTVRAGGRIVVFSPAAGPAWQDLLEALSWPPAFLDLFGPAGRADKKAVQHLTIRQMRVLLRTWRVHHGLSVDDADHMRLVGMLSKPAYRAAAERDLREVHGLDLAAEWQARRWRRLLCLLDGLRRTSHVHEAMTLDEELARLYLEQERRGKVEKNQVRRRSTEYSLEAELLSFAVDRLGELISVAAAGKGAKRRKVQPMPRPDSAIARVRERMSKRKHEYTVARVFGYLDEHGRPTGKGPVPAGIAMPT